MTEHRPGPWKIGPHADELTVIPITVSSEERWPWRIAAVYKNDPDLLPEYDGEAYANAHLIAAAPDLLAVLEAFPEERPLPLVASDGDRAANQAEYMARLRAWWEDKAEPAIAKAKGEA